MKHRCFKIPKLMNSSQCYTSCCVYVTHKNAKDESNPTYLCRVPVGNCVSRAVQRPTSTTSQLPHHPLPLPPEPPPPPSSCLSLALRQRQLQTPLQTKHRGTSLKMSKSPLRQKTASPTSRFPPKPNTLRYQAGIRKFGSMKSPKLVLPREKLCSSTKGLYSP